MEIKNKFISLWVLVLIPTLLTAEPQDLQVFTDFEHLPATFPDQIDFTIGSSPVTAKFEGGFIEIGVFEPYTHSIPNTWIVFNGQSGTITFETPALEVQLYAANWLFNDGSLEVLDTDNNLLTTVTELPNEINPLYVMNPPFFTFNANELGAPAGIGKIILKDDEEIFTVFFATNPEFSVTAIDDFGFTPIANFEPPWSRPRKLGPLKSKSG